MTENEAIEVLKNDSCYECSFGCSGAGNCGNERCNVAKATAEAIKALEKVQAYQTIGTVEEFKALKEKSVAKKPIQDEHFQHDYSCSCCGGKLAESVDDNCCLEEEMAGWCPYCGQKLDW